MKKNKFFKWLVSICLYVCRYICMCVWIGLNRQGQGNSTIVRSQARNEKGGGLLGWQPVIKCATAECRAAGNNLTP